MESILSFITKFNKQTQDEISGTGSNPSPDYIPQDAKKITIDYVTLLLYFVVCFTVILCSIQLGLGSQSISFLTLGITYTLITISLSTSSLFFTVLEIIAGTSIIELVSKLGFDNFAWVLVFILPIITIAHSIYFLLFYLS